jgi:hypothetical protein
MGHGLQNKFGRRHRPSGIASSVAEEVQGETEKSVPDILKHHRFGIPRMRHFPHTINPLIPNAPSPQQLLAWEYRRNHPHSGRFHNRK